MLTRKEVSRTGRQESWFSVQGNRKTGSQDKTRQDRTGQDKLSHKERKEERDNSRGNASPYIQELGR